MDEHMAEIEHLIQHYIHRDLFRLAVSDYFHRRRNYTPRHVPINQINQSTSYMSRHWSDRDSTPEINHKVIHDTREALKRAKLTTVRYLHELLHTETVLNEHEHVHSDGMVFTFVIHESDY